MSVKPTVGFFHVALMNGLGGLMVASEMHGRIMESGLYDATDSIKVSILGDMSQAQVFCDYVLNRHSKYVIHHVSPSLEEWEWPTLDALNSYCKDNTCDVWYAHTKGASNCRPDVPSHIQRNIRSWRGVMCHDIMTRHQECKRLLEENDAVGPLLSLDKPSGPHFVGNFWWATSDHIRSLPPISPERHSLRWFAENWIGSNPLAKLKGLTDLVAYDCYDFTGIYANKGGVFNGLAGAS